MEGTKEQLYETNGTPFSNEAVDSTHGTKLVYTETLSGSGSIDSFYKDNNYDVTINDKNSENLSNNIKNKNSIKKIKIVEWISKNITTIIVGLATCLVALIPQRIEHFRCETRPYVTLEAEKTQRFWLTTEVPNLQYSVGGKKWKDLGTQRIKFGGNNGKLLLRGDFAGGTNGATVKFETDVPVVCTGDIRTLVDYKNYDNAFTGNAKFNNLFDDCEQLTTAPDLKSENLAERCYYRMFAKTSIRIPPKLPAMNLADACYFSMFEDCKLLEEIPELPALNMADECYMRMFYGCTTLKLEEGERILELPASNMAKQCCSSMFEGCKSLKESPKLSATNLAVGCYDKMFAGCISLNHVIMLATEKNATTCMKDWLKGTAPNGIFHKNKKATWDNEGVVPSDWEVKDYN